MQLEMDESSEENKNSAVHDNSGSDEKCEDGETLNEQSEDEPESDEEDDIEGHREPVDHLLKVKIVGRHHIHETFMSRNQVATICLSKMAIIREIIEQQNGY